MKMVTEVSKTSAKNNDSIEQTVEKAKIRFDLFGITEQFIAYMEKINKPIDTFRMLGLPCDDYFFEKGLSHAIENSHNLDFIPAFHFDGVERDLSTACKAYLNKPENATITGCCDFNEFLKKNVTFKKDGRGMIQRSSDRTVQPVYDFIWADFCGEGSVNVCQDFVNMMKNNVKKGLVGITLRLNSRINSDEKYIALFKDYCSSKDIATAIRVTINAMVRKVGIKNVRCVYDVVYAGGKVGRSTMLTLVYSVNLPESAITAIKDNRREFKSTPEYRNRYQIATKIIAKGRWSAGFGKGRKGGRKATGVVVRNARVDSAVTRWEAEWKSLSVEKKFMIATRYGKSVKQFACMVACRHGKLAERINGSQQKAA